MPEPNPSHGLVPGPTGPPAEGVPGSSEKDANLPADSETKPAIPDLNTSELSAIAIVDKWTEATEEEEALDQWGALNAMSSLVSVGGRTAARGGCLLTPRSARTGSRPTTTTL